MKRRVSRFHLITLALFLSGGAALVGFTQHVHVKREAEKRAVREAAALATAEELRRRTVEPNLAFSVEETQWREQGPGHWLLELKVRYRNEGGQELTLGPPVAILTTQEGRTVPEFFLALEPRPVVKAGTEEEVDLRYWVSAGERSVPLWLEIAGDRLALEN